MKDQHIANLQRLAGAALKAFTRRRTAGMLCAAKHAKEDHEAVLWAIKRISDFEGLLAQEAKDADELLRLMGLDPEKYRTDGGFLNVGRIKAAWRSKVLRLRTTPALLISASKGWREAGRSVSAFVADQLAPFPDPVPPAATGRSAARHPLAAEADRLESLGG